MDFIDLIWDLSQERALEDLRKRMSVAGFKGTRALNQHAKLIGLLQQQNEELRLRVGVLIRLLVQHGQFSAEQFSSAIQEARTAIAQSRAQAGERPHKKLPKPPKLKPKKSNTRAPKP